MKHQSLIRAGIGALSLFIVLVILSLTVLSVLSFSEAKQEETLAIQYKNHAIATSKAEKEAITINALLQQKKKSSNEEFQNLIESNQYIYDEAQNMVSYSIDIDDTQQLNVTVIINENVIEIMKWEIAGR